MKSVDKKDKINLPENYLKKPILKTNFRLPVWPVWFNG